jgi:hypothetical protein
VPQPGIVEQLVTLCVLEAFSSKAEALTLAVGRDAGTSYFLLPSSRHLFGYNRFKRLIPESRSQNR